MPLNPFDLRCEYRTHPLGLDVARPRLSWKLAAPAGADGRGARQTAYHLQAARSAAALAAGQADLWDSGRVASAASAQVEYGGAPLGSRQRAWWRVRAWDEQGAPGGWSAPAWWELGLLARDDWRAEWIGAGLVGGPRTSVPAPYLRRAVSLPAAPARARLYVTALGVYEFYINGQRVGEDVLAPGWTDYTRRVRYQVYDVAALLRAGDNALGAALGDGWYCGHVGWFGRQQYGDRPRLLAQLELTLPDGAALTVVSDGAWRAAFGPRLEADLIMGESYDARLAWPGWAAPGFDDRRWLPAEVLPDPGAAREATNGPLVRRQETLRPVGEPAEQRRHGDSRWLFDFGQNLTGRARLRVSGPAGQTLTLRHGEALNPDGTLYTANLRSARQTEYYTLRGGGEETYEPAFTFHGFRYVEVSGWPGRPGPGALEAVVLHSTLPLAGNFECSEPLLNQLQHNIVWGQKGNFLDVPTDCPQRDERLGWTGDAQVFARTAAFNRDVAGFLAKWLQDLDDAQAADGAFPPVAPMVRGVQTDGGPAWADAGLIVPWTLYEAYGDRRALERHYAAMARFVDYLAATSRDHLRCYPGYPGWAGYGDWLSTRAETPKDLIGTAFFAHSARLLARVAAVLGQADDAARYGRLADAVRRAFVERFVTPGGLVAGQTQTAYVLALHFDLLPNELRPAALAALMRDIEARGRHLSTGFVGTPYLLHVLSDAGAVPSNASSLDVPAAIAISPRASLPHADAQPAAAALGAAAETSRPSAPGRGVQMNAPVADAPAGVGAQSNASLANTPTAAALGAAAETSRLSAPGRGVQMNAPVADAPAGVGAQPNAPLADPLAGVGAQPVASVPAAPDSPLELAYALLTQTTWPSWLYPVRQGATTIWERWDGWTAEGGYQDAGMNSFNHYAYGAVGDWLYRVVAGLQPDPEQPGYRHVILKPRPGGKLTWAAASYESAYGLIESAWQRTDSGLDWQVTLPPNTTATAHVPAAPGDRITLDGQPVDGPVVELGAGTYEFVVTRGAKVGAFN